MTAKIIRIKHLLEKTGLSRSTLYKLFGTPGFPAKIQLGERSVGFLESEVDKWIQGRIEASQKVEG
jgi:prophage regulatory protein